MLATHHHFMPRFRRSGPIIQLPLHAFMEWTGTTLPVIHTHGNVMSCHMEGNQLLAAHVTSQNGNWQVSFTQQLKTYYYTRARVYIYKSSRH
jgi:hypothetical protein